VQPSLDGCREKWARGAAFLKRLNELADEYLDENDPPHRVQGGFVPPLSKFIFRGEVTKPVDKLFWGVILGDAMHNLRSALDHLVWQLVLLDTGKDGTSQHQFPICSTGAGYWSITKDGAPSMRDKRLKGITAAHRAIIDEAQPYRRKADGRVPVLEALRDFSNHDKHRLIHTALSAVDIGPNSPFRLVPNADAGEEVGQPRLAPFVEGEEVEIMSIEYSCPGPNPEVVAEGALPIGLGFGDDIGQPIRLPALGAMADEVLRLIEAFAPDFP
jgi:hypothetical protein